jgi:hypothetical protein
MSHERFNWTCVLAPDKGTADQRLLERFEDDIGFELPADYRDFLIKYNGGEIKIEHEIFIRETPLTVHFLWRLTAPRPSFGIIEGRDLQVRNRMCMRQAIGIGDDMGTGTYYMILEGDARGAVFFIWLDNRPMLSAKDWRNRNVCIPSEMMYVSPDFDSFGKMIIEGRTA